MPRATHHGQRAELSRREFISQSSALAVGATVAGPLALRAYSEEGEPDRPASSRVVRVRSDNVVRTNRIDRRVLGDMLRQGLIAGMDTATASEAWAKLLKPDDVIGLKFNRSAATALGTTLPMAEVLIQSLVDAGFAPSQLVPLEVPEAIYQETGTTRPDLTWAAKETDFGSGQDNLAGVLDQVTAIVNVPFLKTHNIAGLTCCLKNLSHALVKHPARFHGNHCSPYIADIVALPAIRNKLRIHIVNSLRVVIDGGPEAASGSVAASGSLLISTDPVATDTVGLEEINRSRAEGRLGPITGGDGKLGYLPHAASIGLGRGDLHEVEMIRIKA